MGANSEFFIQLQDQFLNDCDKYENGNISALDVAVKFKDEMSFLEHLTNQRKTWIDENLESVSNEAIVNHPYGINATEMQMGSNPNRNEKGQYGGTSTAVKLKKGRLNSGAGKLKNRLLNKSEIDWDNEIPSDDYFNELFRVSKNQIIFGGNYFPILWKNQTRGIGYWNKIQPWDNFSQFELIWTSFDFPAFEVKLSNRGGNNSEKKYTLLKNLLNSTKKYFLVLRKMVIKF